MKKSSIIIITLLLIILMSLIFIACSPPRGRIVLKNYTEEDMMLWLGKEGEDYLTNVTESSFNFDEEKALNVLHIPAGTTGTYIYAIAFNTDWDIKIGDTHYIDSKDPQLHDSFNFKLDTSYIFKISGYSGYYSFEYEIEEYD